LNAEMWTLYAGDEHEDSDPGSLWSNLSFMMH